MNLKSVTGKYWKLNNVDKNKILKLTEEFSLSEILCRLLALRNIFGKEKPIYQVIILECPII